MSARMNTRSTNSRRITRRSFLRGSAALATYMLAGASRCGKQRAESRNEEALVIGAGIAGIAAARGLKAAGFPVRIIEGRDRIGGRIWTDRSLGTPVDLGASWIHGDSGDHPIRILADELGVRTLETDQESYRFYDHRGAPVTDERFEELYAATEEIIEAVEAVSEEQTRDVGIGAVLDQVLAKSTLSDEENYVLRWSAASIEASVAGDLADLSLGEYEEEESFGDDDSLFPDGYDGIVKGLAAGLDIQTGTRVRVIHHNSQGVRVETDRGEFSGDGAVITLPLGVLRARGVRFSPELPIFKQGAIRRLAMGTLNKTVISFPKAFWPMDRDYLGYISKQKGDWPSFLNLKKVSGRPMLMAFTGGGPALDLEKKSDRALRRELNALFSKLFAKDAGAIEALIQTRWSRDPFSYGSYSFFARGARGADYDALAEPVGRLFFAGEATSRYYPATVHGAYLSGVREAERIAGLPPNGLVI